MLQNRLRPRIIKRANNSLGDQCSLAKNREQHRKVKRRTPEPMSRIPPIRKLQISPKQHNRKRIENLSSLINKEKEKAIKCTYKGMIQRIRNPKPKRRLGEKLVLLPKRVQLRIPIEEPRRDELVKNTDDQRWKHSEQHVVQRKRPRFIGDLTRKVVEERILHPSQNNIQRERESKLAQNCVM